MLTLFKNAETYSPHFLGTRDILVGGKSILAIADHIDPVSYTHLDVYKRKP